MESLGLVVILILGAGLLLTAAGAPGAAAEAVPQRQLWRPSFRSLNYAAMRRGGAAVAIAGGQKSGAEAAFDGDWSRGWTAPAEAGYPVVIDRDCGRTIRVNSLRVALGPEVLAVPIVYTHNVNPEGQGIGYSMEVGNLAAMLDWFQAQHYQPIFFSEMLRYLRTKRLPEGVTKPLALMFCTGQRGVYEHAFALLKARGMKFNSTCWDLWGLDEHFLKPSQIREMLASGLFEPGIYCKWTTHPINPDKGPLESLTTVAFPAYDPATNEYEPLGIYDERVLRQAEGLVRSLRDDYGYQGDIVWEVPSSFYSLPMLSAARSLGIAMLTNTGTSLNTYGAQTLPNLGMTSMSDGPTLERRQADIISASGAAEVRQYRYEVYISAAERPATGAGWETGGDWHKVVYERPGAGVEVDRLYPRTAGGHWAGIVDQLNGSYVKFRHLRLKVLGERENRPAVVNEVELCYEAGGEAELQEVRLRNLEGEGE
jgi:hypothetical protein